MNLGELGAKGESMVAQFLQKKGHTILKRNYTCRFGEIDIIAEKDNTIIFIEVKSRSENAIVPGLEAVDSHKRRRIIAAATDYIVKTKTELQPRFDVALVIASERNGKMLYSLNYYKNAF